ncbi:MAG: replication-associated recombination protein A, partial [Nitrospira sp.]|nr:replication-associated recombination protein A [Nitrospira sp.]
EDVKAQGNLGVPLHLRNAVASMMKGFGYGDGYRYVHDDPQAKEQEHLPESLNGRRYYRPKSS